MLALSDNFAIAADSIRAHKLRVALTVLGLTMGVATLITVMTLVQGANVYVEQKIRQPRHNVFRISRMPFAVTDFASTSRPSATSVIELGRSARGGAETAAIASTSGPRSRPRSTRATRTTKCRIRRSTAIPPTWPRSTRAPWCGAGISPTIEDRHSARVCLIGDHLASEFFPGIDPVGRRDSPGQHGVHGDRRVREDRLGARAGSGQLRRDPAEHVSEISRPAQQPDAAGEGGRRRRISSAPRTRRGSSCARAATSAPKQRRGFFYRHGGQLHRAVEEHQLGVFRRVRHGELDLGGGGRHRDHERHAGERHGADARRSACGAPWAPRKRIFCGSFWPRA